jgi:hypothetical protein
VASWERLAGLYPTIGRGGLGLPDPFGERLDMVRAFHDLLFPIEKRFASSNARRCSGRASQGVARRVAHGRHVLEMLETMGRDTKVLGRQG